jgi:hypothetical protein
MKKTISTHIKSWLEAENSFSIMRVDVHRILSIALFHGYSQTFGRLRKHTHLAVRVMREGRNRINLLYLGHSSACWCGIATFSLLLGRGCCGITTFPDSQMRFCKRCRAAIRGFRLRYRPASYIKSAAAQGWLSHCSRCRLASKLWHLCMGTGSALGSAYYFGFLCNNNKLRT